MSRNDAVKESKPVANAGILEERRSKKNKNGTIARMNSMNAKIICEAMNKLRKLESKKRKY